MLTLKLAWRNIRGAGLRSFLNILVLAIIYVLIIWMQGLYQGISVQATTDMTREEIAGGHLRHPEYDPEDLIDLSACRQSYEDLMPQVDAGHLEPVLVVNASVYPNGRMQSALLKGISPGQTLLSFPSVEMRPQPDGMIPVLIGTRMAESAQLKTGDEFTVQWRDKNGTFDAASVRVAHIMQTTVPTIDAGQIWLPLGRLQEMTGLRENATFLVVEPGYAPQNTGRWYFADRDELLQIIVNLIETKTSGAVFLYMMLLMMALMAVFDTQMLAVFRRQKEIGTLVALGMTQKNVVRLFTAEGTLFGAAGAALAVIAGTPLCWHSWKNGIYFGDYVDSFSLAISARIFPVYPLKLIITTFVLVMATVIIVSWLPSRNIARMKPTDAIAGRRRGRKGGVI